MAISLFVGNTEIFREFSVTTLFNMRIEIPNDS